MLKSYVLKPIWLFNKATWEKEANTQSTAIFVTTEKHENKIVIHEIGMDFWSLEGCLCATENKSFSCFEIHPASLKTSASKDPFLISPTSSLRIASSCWKSRSSYIPTLSPSRHAVVLCLLHSFLLSWGAWHSSIPFFHSAIFVVVVLKASWSLFVVCWTNALHSFLVCASYVLVWLTRSRLLGGEICFP